MKKIVTPDGETGHRYESLSTIIETLNESIDKISELEDTTAELKETSMELRTLTENLNDTSMALQQDVTDLKSKVGT